MINETQQISRIQSQVDENEFVSFQEGIILVKELVEKTLSTSPKIIRNYTKHLAASSGKYIRGLSLLICAQDKDQMVSKDAIQVGAAIEILHLATLVHDDVIDNASLRRGMITLQKKAGQKTAIICGDYLFCLALKLVANISNFEKYLKLDIPDYMGRVCLGELNQHINNYNLDLTVFEYMKIISGKTAALFEASFYSGCIFCKEEREDMNKYRRLGQYIGMIFQLTDDCIDFEKTEDIAKKPVQSDFEQGVITLPLIHAFEKLEGFKKLAKTKGISREEINEAVKKSGGLNYTKMTSKKYYNKSMKLIKELNSSQEKKEQLIWILNTAYGKKNVSTASFIL